MKVNELKLWWVVAWDHYYPDSSLGNVKRTFATKAEADEEVKEMERDGRYDRVTVIDISEYLGLPPRKVDDDDGH